MGTPLRCQAPQADGSLLADLGVRREVLQRQNVERRKKLRSVRSSAASRAKRTFLPLRTVLRPACCHLLQLSKDDSRIATAGPSRRALAVVVRPESEASPPPARRRQHFLKARVPSQVQEQISNGWMDQGWLTENVIYNISSRVTRFEGQREDFAAGRLHLFPAGHEVRPIGALHQHVRQNLGNQLARRFFVEKRDGIHGFERQRHLGALVASSRIGREGPFIRRTLASEFRARIRRSPSERDCSSSRIWPGCSRS